MSDTSLFFVIFGSIILAAVLVSWILCHGPKIVVHKHIHKYKISKDYSRLWDLIMGQPLGGIIESVVIIDKSSLIYRYNTASRGSEHIWVGNEKFPIKEKGKKEFIALCIYKDVEFLDLTDEIEENSLK